MASTGAAPAVQESPEVLARMGERIIGERNPRGIPAAVFVVRRMLFSVLLDACVVAIRSV